MRASAQVFLLPIDTYWLKGVPFLNKESANLRHKEKWLDYFACMRDSLPLRRVATKLNIDLTTAFRWRHRFLEMPTKNQPKQVAGIVEADETFVLDSLKGQKNIPHREARKRDGQASKQYELPASTRRSMARNGTLNNKKAILRATNIHLYANSLSSMHI